MENQNKKTKKGILYLIPSLLGAKASVDTLSPQVIKIINEVDILLSEKAKTTRALLGRLPIKKPLQEFDIRPLNVHTTEDEVESYLQLLRAGNTIGIISEAGCPGVADPGSFLVRLAHYYNIAVVPLAGPCSILLGLMGSGLNGQNFAFVGYLAKEKQKRIKRILELEKISSRENQTQIFIETPYRSHHLFSDLVENLRPDTRLAIAADLTLPTQFIAQKSVFEWQKIKRSIVLKNKYVVFLIHAGAYFSQRE